MAPAKTSTRLATTGVVLIALGTLTLVYLAVHRPVAAVAGPAPGATGAVAELPDDSFAPTETATPLMPVYGEVLLDAVSASVAWRVTNDAGTETGGPGACTAFRHPSSASMTSDGGATWTGIELPFVRVMQVRAASADAVGVIGSDGDCSAGFASTADGGATWTKGPLPNDFWYVDATHFKAVHLGTLTTTPCPTVVRQLSAQTATRAAVLCDDGSARATTDAGKTWAETGAPKGAVALTATSDTPLLAMRGGAGCPGLSIVASGGKPRGCVGIGANGTAALDSTDSHTVWAATPGTSAVSTDGGVTWSP